MSDKSGSAKRFINYKNLKSTIDSELGPCEHCKNTERTLEQTQNVSFTTTFEIVCKPCISKKEKERLELVYLEKKINTCIPVNMEEKSELRKVKLKRDYKKGTIIMCTYLDERIV